MDFQVALYNAVIALLVTVVIVAKHKSLRDMGDFAYFLCVFLCGGVSFLLVKLAITLA